MLLNNSDILRLKRRTRKMLEFLKIYLPFCGYPLNNNENYKPFFIVGSGRSGNTLLRRILNEHNELYIPPETYVMGEIIGIYQRYYRIGWSHLVKLIYSSYEFHPDFYTFQLDNLGPLYKRVSLLDKKHRSLAYALNSFYEYYKLSHNLSGKTWGDKTPINTFYLNEIKSVFPDAKFIHMIRNPYDAIYSHISAGLYDDLKKATDRWRVSVELAKEFGKNNHNYLEIEYEQLVRQPELTIKKACKFLNIEFEETMMEFSEKNSMLGDVQVLDHHAQVLKPITDSSIGRGLKEMSSDEVSEINKVLSQSNHGFIKKMIVHVTNEQTAS